MTAKQVLHTEVLAQCLQENYRHVFLTLIMSYSNKQGPLSLVVDETMGVTKKLQQ